jgi:hypothetical protein
MDSTAGAGVYCQRHPEKTVLYRVLFHYFEMFLTGYDSCFEREHGCFRAIIKELVERYLDCGNSKCGFARIHCPDCGEAKGDKDAQSASAAEKEILTRSGIGSKIA